MKRAGNLISQICEMDNLRQAWLKTVRGKAFSRSVREFRPVLSVRLHQIAEQLRSGSVSWGPYYCFTIYDPKERVIKVAPLSNRIAYHAICNVCEPIFDRYQIYDSYACRVGKGQFAALERAQQFARRNEWYLKLDVRKYFDSISHEVLFQQLQRLFKDPVLLELFSRLLDSYESSPGRGIPIGSLTSQFFANHCLGTLDHVVKEHLHVRCYLRYMDDMLLFGGSSWELQQQERAIRTFLEENLRLELKPFQLNRTKRGIPFLGLRVYCRSLRLSHRARYRFRRKYRANCRMFRAGLLTRTKFLAKMETLFAFLRRTDSVKFRQRILQEGFGS